MYRWLLVGWLTTLVPVQADEMDLESRVRLLEQRLSSRAMVTLLRQVEQMQKEIQALRGQLEESQHELERLREDQRRQYLDLDGRLRRLEGGDLAAGGDQAPTPPAELVSPPPPDSRPAPSPVAQPQVRSSPVAPASPEGEAEAYRQAYQALRAGHYDAAIDAFSEFLQTHPTGDYADNALYWLGEAYYVKRDFNAARDAFQQVVEKFPDSPKAPDALLKLGYVDYEQGRMTSAARSLQKVIQQFPGSRAASLAEQRLQQIRGR